MEERGGDGLEVGSRGDRDDGMRITQGSRRTEENLDRYKLNRYGGIYVYYAIWWEGKTVQKNVGPKFWQKP
jgi:hypothetical protein